MQETKRNNKKENKTTPQGNKNRSNMITGTYDQNPTVKKSRIIVMRPNTFGVLNENDYVFGGMEGGCQEEATNLQERGTTQGILPHVMHEGLYIDLSPDFRAPDNSRNKKL